MSEIKTCYTLTELMDEKVLEESIINLHKLSLEEHRESGKTNKGYNSFEEAMTDINSSSKCTTADEYKALMAACF